MTIFERKLPTEEADEAQIIRGILKVQAAFAAAQKRALGRGTHTKGICARATFEVFDLTQTIGDERVLSRLAHGVYAKPGVYQATVRFANAASTIYPDRQADLRAMSFSVELPPGMGTPYQDYSLQTAPTFPINDAHTFAVLMSVLSASTGAEKLKVLRGLSLIDTWRFLRAAVVGGLQEHRKTAAFQKMRYWSTVPFRNGPYEAVMYSAVPRADNPAQPLDAGDNALQDELIRHLDNDTQMSSFDFALQLLDAEHMTHWGMRRDPSFWVENATVPWKESQTPFHVVARLTLEPKSAMQPSECEPRHIDVTDHATADTQPLGSINRARRAAEQASMQVRRGEATADSVLQHLPMPAEAPRSRLAAAAKAFAAVLVLVMIGYQFAGPIYRDMAARNVPALQHVDEVRYLPEQGWGPDRESADRETFYYTGQGTSMHGIRYSWFVHLEQPFSRQRLADPDHMRALNFIVELVPTHANPDQLPLGFARRFDDTAQDYLVDLTCSACHTGEFNVTKNGHTTAIRIDGGSSLAAITDTNMGSFQTEVLLSTADTLVNPFKFWRFANRVLPADGNTTGAKWKLWWTVAGVGRELLDTARGSSAPKLYPTQEGYGRTDALARIGNVVFGDHIAAKNYHTGDAPVSFPYLWNIWKFDWVQYGASVSQPMARNVGEAMGVGASFQFVDDFGRPIPKEDRYRSSVSFDNLARLENTLQKLAPPAWPKDLLGDVNPESANRGKAIFNNICAKCHGPHIASEAWKWATSPTRQASDPLWAIRYVDLAKIGTDPNAARNFYQDAADLTLTGLTLDEVRALLKPQFEAAKTRQDAMISALTADIARLKASGDKDALNEAQAEMAVTQSWPLTDESIAQLLDGLDVRNMNVGRGLNIFDILFRERYYEDQHVPAATQACLNGFDTLDLPQVVLGYKPRPLQGVWATPPFLHNGSVPTIYALLSPVKDRPTRFFVGRREYDPDKLGYRTEPALGTSGGFWYDVRLPGNHNTGHEFSDRYKESGSPEGVIGPAFSDQDRKDVIEYLKVHSDPPTPPRKPVDCFAGMTGSAGG